MSKYFRLTDEHRIYVIRRLAACHATLSIMRGLKEEFGITVAKQSVDHYNPERTRGYPVYFTFLGWVFGGVTTLGGLRAFYNDTPLALRWILLALITTHIIGLLLFFERKLYLAITDRMLARLGLPDRHHSRFTTAVVERLVIVTAAAPLAPRSPTATFVIHRE